MSEKALDTLVSELARSLRIEVPAKRRDGSYKLRFDNRHNVTLSSVPGGDILIAGRLSRLPNDQTTRNVIVRECMQFALGRAGSSKTCLSLDKQTNALFLHRLVAPDTAAMAFEENVSDFVNDLFWWKSNVGSQKADTSAPHASATTTPMQFLHPNMLVR